MNRLLLAGAFACLLSTHAWAVDSDGTRPDPKVTPGEIRTTSRDEICGHTTKEFRNVSTTTKIAARRAYGLMSPRSGWCAAGEGCEQDHRVPLTVGGDNKPGSIRNIWPQRPDGPFGFRVKDKCEAAVGRDICAGKISVRDAQAVFLGDWRVNCKPWVPELPDMR